MPFLWARANSFSRFSPPTEISGLIKVCIMLTSAFMLGKSSATKYWWL
jgi:hypothetical protein